MTGMKRQIQKASSEINKQSIYRGKKIFFFFNRELSESKATFPAQGAGNSQQALILLAQRGILFIPGLCTLAT